MANTTWVTPEGIRSNIYYEDMESIGKYVDVYYIPR